MIAAVIPALDEEGAIGAVVSDIPRKIQGEDVSVFVVDGGSEDRTVDEAEAAGATVIKQRYPGGKGAAMRQAFDDIDAEVYVFLDGDGTYRADEMPSVVEPILDGEADHVIGSRMENREDGAIKPLNLFGESVFNFMVRRFYRTDITDMLSGYRAISRELVDRLPVFSDHFGIETELTLLSFEADARLVEVPITYRKRTSGESKLGPFSAGYRILTTMVLLARDNKPLKFFSWFAAVFFLAGLYPSWLVVQEKIQTGFVQHVTPAVLASLLFIFALQTFAFGMLADQQRNTQRRIEKLMRRS